MERVREVIVVEGRYDKITLSQTVDAVILETREVQEGGKTRMAITAAVERAPEGASLRGWPDFRRYKCPPSGRRDGWPRRQLHGF